MIELISLETGKKVAEFAWNMAKKAGMDKVLLDKIGRNPVKMAFALALQDAYADFAPKHPTEVAELFDSIFLEHAGAPILAQFLLPAGAPEPSKLAEAWTKMLNVKRAEQRHAYIREMEPVAADFIEIFDQKLHAKAELKEINEWRARDQLLQAVKDIRDRLNSNKASFGTRQDYLHWLIERNLYLDPRGTLQTERQVQVKLDEVYIGLCAQSEEKPADVDRRLLEKELKEGKLFSEDFEDRLDALDPLLVNSGNWHYLAHSSQPVSLSSVVKRHEKLVILGDPGSGKSTLIRYTALKHAEALYSGARQAGKNGEFGMPRFPIFIRVAEYAEENLWKKVPLSEFLVENCAIGECPRPGLADLLETELAGGNCLVMLDGLDEIVSADDRRGVVQKIEDFVRRHDDKPNRFLITSRIAGYRSAPLAAPFAHYTVQEMDRAQIRRFLEAWCPAVEAAQTSDLSPQARQATAQAEIEAITDAVDNNEGVQRLAANPLMLRTLALIHRAGKQMPQRRVELYKLAADTLGRTWRIAQGVKEDALVKEEYLNPALSELAYWMHTNKPSGLATEREVYSVLGKVLAKYKRVGDWDDDNPDPAILEEVNQFLSKVRQHTGLFVERAPRRYGFMHLTFEEYYAARFLVARSSTRAKLIYQHKHDPRWQEPILLALGFLGMDYPQDAADLLETSILAQGEEAEEHGFKPSEHEDLLGRDYLFALRCLGDRIPVRPALVNQLMQRLSQEVIYNNGVARYSRYCQELEKRLEFLRGSQAAEILLPSLLQGLQNFDPEVRARTVKTLGQYFISKINVVKILLEKLEDSEPYVQRIVASYLQEAASNIVIIEDLLEKLKNPASYVRCTAVNILKEVAVSNVSVVEGLLATLKDDSEWIVRGSAASSLRKAAISYTVVVEGLLAALKNDPEVEVRSRAANSLKEAVVSNATVVEGLLAALKNDPRMSVRSEAASSLKEAAVSNATVVEGLLAALKNDPEREVRGNAAHSLKEAAISNAAAVEGLLVVLKNDIKSEVRSRAANSLRNAAVSNAAAVEGLLTALKDSDLEVHSSVVNSLVYAGLTNAELQHSLYVTLQGSKNWHNRYAAARWMGWFAYVDQPVIDLLFEGLRDIENAVGEMCVKSLTQLSRRFPSIAPAITVRLREVLSNPQFDRIDYGLSGQDHAYNGLWMILTGEEIEED